MQFIDTKANVRQTLLTLTDFGDPVHEHDTHNRLSLAMPDGDGNENFSNKYIL
jgi:hypothetical protein